MCMKDGLFGSVHVLDHVCEFDMYFFFCMSIYSFLSIGFSKYEQGVYEKYPIIIVFLTSFSY